MTSRIPTNLIKSHRQARNLTAEAIAKRIGVDRSTVARIEQGNTDAPISRFAAIAAVLGVSIGALFDSGPAGDKPRARPKADPR